MATIILQCVECGLNPQHSRGLCPTCYSAAQRGGYLNDYPTQNYLDNPESHIRWGFGNNLDYVKDIALEYGYVLVKAD